MQYLNSNRLFDISSDIVEWDMHSAGISIIQEYKMLTQERIDKLLKLPKDRMNISVGKIGQADSTFARDLDDNFNVVIKEFIKLNNLDIEYDILSIKRDAVFTINKVINTPSIGKFINFVPKNRYHAYVYIKPYEFYFRTDNTIDIKGLCGDKDDRDKILNLHKNGIINFLNEAIKTCEKTNMNRDDINEFCANFVSMYKKKELDFDYYREFNVESRFRYNNMGSEMLLDNIDLSLLNKIDIRHNYLNIILPMINYMC
jgi:hypothetical protein